VNPRYFTDANGKAIYLAGSHNWNDVQDESDAPVLDFNAYLNFLQQHGHNFTRGWVWEQAQWAPWSTAAMTFTPLIYLRTGPGRALDGEPKFDVTQFNQLYFDDLRSRVVAAGNMGIYFSVMLFEGWGVGTKPGEPGNAWPGHPFNASNNVNAINGDLNGDGNGLEIQTLASATITSLQEAYVRKVIDTLNDLDNVIWEVCNEANADSVDWQYHFVQFIHTYESSKLKQHPVWLTVLWPDGLNSSLFSSTAEAIAPDDSSGDYEALTSGPQAGDGRRVIISDSDHLWGQGGDGIWVWKSFTRGLNVAFMDDLTTNTQWESARMGMGQTVQWSKRIDLVHMIPHGELTSTAFALANPGTEYLAYQPAGGSAFTMTLSTGSYNYEWMNTSTGVISATQAVAGGTQPFTPPFTAPAVLHIWASLVPLPAVNISASPTTILLGQSSTLTWSSTNASACVASGDWSGTKAVSGSEAVTPSSIGTKTYTLSCSGLGGTTSNSTTVILNRKGTGRGVQKSAR